MQNPKQKFRQSSIVFEKPGILSENLKTDKFQLVQYFWLKLHMFPTYRCLQKSVWDYFYYV